MNKLMLRHYTYIEVRELILSQTLTIQDFFFVLGQLFDPLDARHKYIENAAHAAQQAFIGVKRDDGSPYFENHALPVAFIAILLLQVTDYKTIAGCFLHDNPEDIPLWTIQRVQAVWDDELALDISLVTKENWQDMPGLNTEEKKSNRDKRYFCRLWNTDSNRAVIIKVADIIHNSLTSNGIKRKKKLDQLATQILPLVKSRGFNFAHHIETLYFELSDSMYTSTLE